MKRTLTAEICRRAADEWLSEDDGCSVDGTVASCVAIHYIAGQKAYHEVCDILIECEGTCSSTVFNDFPEGPERQGARFLWLHFLACVLEDGAL